MFKEVVRCVQAYQPGRIQHEVLMPEAAVLMPVTRSCQPELVLTRRADSLSTHSGEVAFPGGRRDPGDPDLLHTALRESQEEVGLDPARVEIAGSLSQLVSRHGIKVTPYVGVVPEDFCYRPNRSEIASIFRVPLEFFVETAPETTHRIDYQGRSWYVPSYRYHDYKIWGLTAAMVVELCHLVYGMELALDCPPALLRREL